MKNIIVTSGKFRGRNLKSPNSNSTHPMGAREKLALFNMIAEFLPGARVLDAFAGSGALGIEAISRGAAEVVFIEKSPKIASTIKQNLANLGLNAKIITEDVLSFNDNQKFDIVLADPPYDNFKSNLIEKITDNVASGGIMVLSHPNKAPDLSGMKLIKTNQYARAHLSLYVK